MTQELYFTEETLAKDNPMLEKVRKLREQLAEAEKAYNDDLDRRRAELDDEAREAGLVAAKRGRKSGGSRVCKVCGETGHNARRHSKSERKKAEATA